MGEGGFYGESGYANKLIRSMFLNIDHMAPLAVFRGYKAKFENGGNKGTQKI